MLQYVGAVSWDCIFNKIKSVSLHMFFYKKVLDKQ